METKPRRFQFSLATLLAATIAIGACIGWYTTWQRYEFQLKRANGQIKELEMRNVWITKFSEFLADQLERERNAVNNRKQ